VIDMISGALAGLRSAADLIRVAVDTRDAAKLAEARSALLDRIIDVQTACIDLQAKQQTLSNEKHAMADRIRDLEDELRELKATHGKIERYARAKTAAGAVVYIDKETEGAADGPVYACAACMGKGKVTTLQPQRGGAFLVCPEGHPRIPTGKRLPAPRRQVVARMV